MPRNPINNVCSICGQDVVKSGHLPACRIAGIHYDILCPGCGSWGGGHPGRWTGLGPNPAAGLYACDWEYSDAIPALKPGFTIYHVFGRWGYLDSNGHRQVYCQPAKVQAAPTSNGATYYLKSPTPIGAPLVDPVVFTTPFAGEQPQAKRLCECGAHATGAADYTPGHSTWCPAFSAAFKSQPDLVAMVRSTPKKLRP